MGDFEYVRTAPVECDGKRRRAQHLIGDTDLEDSLQEAYETTGRSPSGVQPP